MPALEKEVFQPWFIKVFLQGMLLAGDRNLWLGFA